MFSKEKFNICLYNCRREREKTSGKVRKEKPVKQNAAEQHQATAPLRDYSLRFPNKPRFKVAEFKNCLL